MNIYKCYMTFSTKNEAIEYAESVDFKGHWALFYAGFYQEQGGDVFVSEVTSKGKWIFSYSGSRDSIEMVWVERDIPCVGGTVDLVIWIELYIDERSYVLADYLGFAYPVGPNRYAL